LTSNVKIMVLVKFVFGIQLAKTTVRRWVENSDQTQGQPRRPQVMSDEMEMNLTRAALRAVVEAGQAAENLDRLSRRYKVPRIGNARSVHDKTDMMKTDVGLLRIEEIAQVEERIEDLNERYKEQSKEQTTDMQK